MNYIIVSVSIEQLTIALWWRPLTTFYQTFINLINKTLPFQHLISKEKHFKQNFANFENKLKVWYEEHGLEKLHLDDKIKKIKGKPFEQFKTPKQEGYEQRKNEKLLHKKKARQYIKKIKIQNLCGDEEKPKTIGIESGDKTRE